jgi:hypothetical protein
MSRRRASHTQYVRSGGATRLSHSAKHTGVQRREKGPKGYKRYSTAEEPVTMLLEKRWGRDRIERAASSRTLPIGNPKYDSV